MLCQALPRSGAGWGIAAAAPFFPSQRWSRYGVAAAPVRDEKGLSFLPFYSFQSVPPSDRALAALLFNEGFSFFKS